MTKQEVINELKKKITKCEAIADAKFKAADDAWEASNRDSYTFCCNAGNMYLKTARAYKDALKMVKNIKA